jgi:FtsZ-interacting cell division protein ZipA
MNTTAIIILAVVVLAMLVAAFYMMRRRNSERLRSRFGPEYDRIVDEIGAKDKAEAQLHERQKRVEKYELKTLPAEERETFITRWGQLQTSFVDDPSASLKEADTLLGEVMAARGYPMEDFDQRADDISVHHPVVVQSYREGHEIAVREGAGEVGTEDRRRAMLCYRRLFDELVGETHTTEPRPEVTEKVEANER